MKRRGFLVTACAGPLAAAAAMQDPGLAPARSLRDELAAALRVARPLVVMVSLHGCAFCKVVREHHLVPLARDGLPVVQVDMRSERPVLGFTGELLTHDGLVRAWGIDAAPTLLFFGPGAREVAPRLRGASIPDFYGAYLDERIRTARREFAVTQR